MPKKSVKYRNCLGKNGKYWWVCISRNGKKIERSTRCTDRSDAEAVRDELLRKIGLERFGLEVPSPFDKREVPTIYQAAKEWVEVHESVLSERYRQQMIEAVEIHLALYRDQPLDQLTTEMMELARKRYIQGRGAKALKGVAYSVGHSIGGANRLIRLISALYGWAIKQRGYLSSRPWRMTETKVQRTSRPIVWPEQVQAYFAAVDRHTRSTIIRLSIRMQIGLGLRETETSTADWQWVNWRTKSYAPGATKNRKTRQIPIPGWLFDLLRERWETLGKPSRGLVLPYDEDESLIYRGFTGNAVLAAGSDLGIEGLHPHRLRATFATAHFEVGTPLAQIMLMLGHDKPTTTLRYIETRPKEAAEAQDRVAKAMGF